MRFFLICLTTPNLFDINLFSLDPGGLAKSISGTMSRYLVLAARLTSLTSIGSREVDVPRFELGASTMPR